MKPRAIAALLAFFLGAFGGQKFYMGRTGAGILSLLFFWTTIPSWIALYDLIMCAVMKDAEWERKYMVKS